jgi:hypothetical protein
MNIVCVYWNTVGVLLVENEIPDINKVCFDAMLQL